MPRHSLTPQTVFEALRPLWARNLRIADSGMAEASRMLHRNSSAAQHLQAGLACAHACIPNLEPISVLPVAVAFSLM